LIDQDEFVRRRTSLEREIAHWESWTTESEQMALELALCVEAVDKLAFIWDHSDDEDRQGFVRNLFEWVEYDLDARRITNFRLKPWADRFIVLRGTLYANEKEASNEEASEDSAEDSAPQGQKQAVPHRDLRGRAFQHLVDGIAYGMVLFYIGQSVPTFPLTDHTPTKQERNDEIRSRYAAGETIITLAEAFGLSQQRVCQIIRGRRQ
jgi:hypothetical protein